MRPNALFRFTVAAFMCFILTGFESQALDPGFYRHQKTLKEIDKKREKGAKFHAKKRSIRKIEKISEAKRYKKVRKRLIRQSEKRKKLLKKDLIAKEKSQAKKRKQALKFAKKRRKSDLSWQDEIIEYDIKIPRSKKAK